MSVVIYPNQTRNYCIFDENRIKQKVERADFEEIKASLKNPKSEEDVLENLYTLNLILDKGKNKEQVAKLYPELSKYNDTRSANIQTYLAGIYRKTKVPDAFGPLVKMLIQDSINPIKDAHFDPTEEIGGAILDYLA